MDQESSRSRAYLAWVVGILALAQTSSFADRTVIVVLQPMIKREFVLSDFQVGLLGGLAFSAVYAVLGLPLARLAERRSRRAIIVASLLIWSAMTTLCGIASSYVALFLLRFGVGIGEAGSTPSAHSMLADYFAPRHRGRAMSVLTLGTPFGALLGSVIGGVVSQHYGWRTAFIVVGLPGVLLATLILATVQEPKRQASTQSSKVQTAGGCLKALLGRPFYRHLLAAQVLAAISGYGISAFAAIYLTRAFGFEAAQAGIVLGLAFGIFYAAGLLAGGLSHDRLGFGWIPALATLAAAPVTIASYISLTATMSVVMIIGSCFLQAIALAPTYAAIHNRVHPNMRATAIAVLLLQTNLIGAGLGPALVGFASDHLAAFAFAPSDPAYAIACPGGNPAQDASPMLAAACRGASTFGLRWAIVLVALSFIWSSIHYALAARRMREESIGIEPEGLAGAKA